MRRRSYAKSLALLVSSIFAVSCGDVLKKDQEENQEESLTELESADFLVRDGESLSFALSLPEDVSDLEGSDAFDWNAIEENTKPSERISVLCKATHKKKSLDQVGILYLTLTKVSRDLPAVAESHRVPLRCKGSFIIRIGKLEKGTYQLGLFVANKKRQLVFQGKSEIFEYDAGRIKVEMERVKPGPMNPTKTLYVYVVFPKDPVRKSATITCHFEDIRKSNKCMAYLTGGFQPPRITASADVATALSDNAESSSEAQRLSVAPHFCTPKGLSDSCKMRVYQEGTYAVSSECSNWTQMTVLADAQLGENTDVKLRSCLRTSNKAESREIAVSND